MILEIEISFYSHRLINFWRSTLTVLSVVYLLIPTSNHNVPAPSYDMRRLYIFWFLHQTTTYLLLGIVERRCISFDSYIKPQPLCPVPPIHRVVYLLIPTSNHNSWLHDNFLPPLYIFWFLHQTTTNDGQYIARSGCISFDSYIKPQPGDRTKGRQDSCISFDSYIKPQLYWG